MAKKSKIVLGMKVTDKLSNTFSCMFFAIGTPQTERIEKIKQDRSFYNRLKDKGLPRYSVKTIYA